MNGSVTPIKPRVGPLPVAEIVSVTPRLANEWLKSMVANRPLSDKKVMEYAIAIDQGQWVLNGETIKFDKDGHLFDGQHRLRAGILADKAFLSHVVRGIEDPNAFATVDTGKARTAKDVFGIAGWQNNAIASGAALVLYAVEHKRLGWGGIVGSYSKGGATGISARLRRGAKLDVVSRDELYKFAVGIEQELAQAVRYANGSHAGRVMPRTSIAALYYMFRQKSATDADRFFTDLGEGVGLQKQDPVYVLRERLLRAKKDARLTRWAILGFAIKAWNARRAGKVLALLRVTDGEQFPKVK
jgi:hypothetical protein